MSKVLKDAVPTAVVTGQLQKVSDAVAAIIDAVRQRGDQAVRD